MIELNDSKDSLLQLKEKRIEILKFQVDTRTNQLIETNQLNIDLKKSIKQMKFKLFAWKITAIAGIIATYLIFK